MFVPCLLMVSVFFFYLVCLVVYFYSCICKCCFCVVVFCLFLWLCLVLFGGCVSCSYCIFIVVVFIYIINRCGRRGLPGIIFFSGNPWLFFYHIEVVGSSFYCGCICSIYVMFWGKKDFRTLWKIKFFF